MSYLQSQWGDRPSADLPWLQESWVWPSQCWRGLRPPQWQEHAWRSSPRCHIAPWKPPSDVYRWQDKNWAINTSICNRGYRQHMHLFYVTAGSIVLCKNKTCTKEAMFSSAFDLGHNLQHFHWFIIINHGSRWEKSGMFRGLIIMSLCNLVKNVLQWSGVALKCYVIFVGGSCPSPPQRFMEIDFSSLCLILTTNKQIHSDSVGNQTETFF